MPYPHSVNVVSDMGQFNRLGFAGRVLSLNTVFQSTYMSIHLTADILVTENVLSLILLPGIDPSATAQKELPAVGGFFEALAVVLWSAIVRSIILIASW